MKINDLVDRNMNPAPWEEGENIPWNDPNFSRRMLKEHLSQKHNAASRTTSKINSQIKWIYKKLLPSRPCKILDLACGPGLYTNRLAKMGHESVGIDYSPASIEYARKQAKEKKLASTYKHADIREADFGNGFDLVMLIYGEFNIFKKPEAAEILSKAYAALNEGGKLLLEPHTFNALKKIGLQPPYWHSKEKGIFSDTPYICLTESFWRKKKKVTIIRYYIIDTNTHELSRHSQTFQAYTNDEYFSLLNKSGFDEIEFFLSLTGVEDDESGNLMAIIGRKT